MPSTFLHSSSCNIFTPAHFISSTTLTILSSFTFDCLIFSNKSTLSTITSTFFVLLTSSYSGYTNVLSLLSLFTSTFQSGLLLKLSTFSILLPETCFSVKLNFDRQYIYYTCFLFNFCAFMKYFKFLQSVYILNLVVVPSKKYFHISKHLTTTNIFLSYISQLQSVSLSNLEIKTIGLHSLSVYFIDSTLSIIQFEAFVSTLNSLSKSGATSTSFIIKIPLSSSNTYSCSFFYYYFISFLVSKFIGLIILAKSFINLLQ